MYFMRASFGCCRQKDERARPESTGSRRAAAAVPVRGEDPRADDPAPRPADGEDVLGERVEDAPPRVDHADADGARRTRPTRPTRNRPWLVAHAPRDESKAPAEIRFARARPAGGKGPGAQNPLLRRVERAPGAPEASPGEIGVEPDCEGGRRVGHHVDRRRRFRRAPAPCGGRRDEEQSEPLQRSSLSRKIVSSLTTRWMPSSP